MSLSWGEKKLTWLITGASSGFGLALTRLALEGGHRVIATSRNPSSYPDIEKEITSKGGELLALDINAPDSADVIYKLQGQGVEVDILVNCAGSAILGPAESFNEDEVRALAETAYFGPYRLIRAVAPGMRTRRRGMIVNVSTGSAVDGRESMAVYGASKAAMDTLMHVMGKELALFDIRTLTIHLGAFDTSFASNSVRTTSKPLPSDYNGTIVDKVVGSVKQKFTPDGDHKKATQVIYEMITGEGYGKGKESERVMLLGRDMWACQQAAADKVLHKMNTFEAICNNVYLDK
ncbi:unnamed protein product [Clonostachys rosea f. rosea IK726]|uniref:Uncharacterized protein n=2 Tax=Bionectria ochroleuca TaxID=29856 RepID=A0A0B7K584_BIOOC|nr:unnamed protein product [Clonostachys rosea f. rosea IK726]